ncbi:unnamed protein product, partial [Phaeothamnion confervicola]
MGCTTSACWHCSDPKLDSEPSSATASAPTSLYGTTSRPADLLA